MAAVLALAGCKREADRVEPPPRSETMPPVPSEASFVGAPIAIDSAILKRAVEEAVPQTLWTIDRHFDRCVPPQRVKAFGARIKLAPKIGCDIVGTVTRGPIRLRGQGRDLIAELPLRANMSARDVGGVFKGKTATGSAMAHAIVRLDLAPDWSPKASVRLRYNWTREPGIDFLGHRIEFTRQADSKLKPVVRRLERELPRKLARVKLRPQVERAWASLFTVQSLNRADPPVWLRVTPQEPVYDGYVLDGDTIRLQIGLKALTETFVGERPAAPGATPLPAPARDAGHEGLRFFVPVIAQYAELEPVIDRALAKRAKRAFEVPRLGAVDARFGKVTAYATGEGRLAVGFSVTATPRSGVLGETKGQIWLTARPVVEENSARVRFTGLKVKGDIGRTGGAMLIDLANSPSVIAAIEQSLTRNFQEELDGLVENVGNSIAERRQGDFLIHTELTEVKTGQLAVYGSGLYLLVQATGTARIAYSARR